MPSLESINELLEAAVRTLNQAAAEISDFRFEPVSEHMRSIGRAIGNIAQIQHQVYMLKPELRPHEETPDPDRDLTDEEKAIAANLSEKNLDVIDQQLLSNAKPTWRKVAMLVGLAMGDLPDRVVGIPDVFYAQRVRTLVERGLLEAQGNLQYMRFSEVRLPSSESGT